MKLILALMFVGAIAVLALAENGHFLPRDCTKNNFTDLYKQCAKLDRESLEAWHCVGTINELTYYCVSDPEAVKKIDFHQSFWQGLSATSAQLFKGHRWAIFDYLKPFA